MWSVNDFELRGVLGRGQFGVVFQADSKKIGGKTCALRICKDGVN
jgi:hypothetical protein